ncbi:MAG: transposase family protein [Alphaproteobacteria bacterium]|nr:transposase family protein [Alphaproteobacteria bacterium]
MTKFVPLLGLLADVPDPRRAQGQIDNLPHVLLFSILAIVTGGNSYRGIVTFIDVNRRKLNAAFGLTWRRAPAHTAIRSILKGSIRRRSRLSSAAMPPGFRPHARPPGRAASRWMARRCGAALTSSTTALPPRC